MKQIFILILVLSTVFGCKSKKEDPVEEVISQNEDYYNCSEFFGSGDYRSFCTIDAEAVTILDETIDGGGTVCKYIIPGLNPKTDVNTGVYFMSLPTTEMTKNSFEMRKTSSEKAAYEDPKIFHSEISIGNHDGYISEGNFANYSKTISARYKNVLVSVSVVYYKDFFKVTPPCNYDTTELIKLMKVVLENM